MITLNEVANDSRGITQRFGRKILLRIDPAQHFAINQKHALQDAVLAHQIFRRPDLGFFLYIFLFLLSAEQQTRARQCSPGKDNATSEKNSAVKKSLVSVLILHVFVQALS